MKKILFALCAIITISHLNAQTVKKSLTAKKIKKELYLDYDSKSFSYGLKKDELINQTITNEKSFSSKETSVSVFIKSKNPILNELTIETKTIENLSYKKYKDELNNFISQFKEVSGFEQKDFESLAQAEVLKKDFLDAIESIVESIKQTNENNYTDKINSIKNDIKKINQYISNQKSNLKLASENWYQNTKLFEAEAEIAATLNAYYKLLFIWKEKIEINPFEEKKIDNISRDSLQVVNIKVTPKELKFDRTNKKLTLEKKEAESINTTLNFEKFSRFVPEVRPALVYTNLTFPKFGTETNDSDELVVADAGEEKFNKINAGLMINFNYYTGDDEFVPFFQLGAGPSKKYPILFSGVGVRLNEKLMISGGGAWTWINELSSLAIGDLVSGTSVIEDDQKFKFTTKPKLYLSIQFKL